MKEQKENEYVKRTQKDYSYAFKLSVIQEVDIINFEEKIPFYFVFLQMN